jgi:hypothetical protein
MGDVELASISSKRYSKASVLPLRAAKCMGVCPKVSGASTKERKFVILSRLAAVEVALLLVLVVVVEVRI